MEDLATGFATVILAHQTSGHVVDVTDFQVFIQNDRRGRNIIDNRQEAPQDGVGAANEVGVFPAEARVVTFGINTACLDLLFQSFIFGDHGVKGCGNGAQSIGQAAQFILAADLERAGQVALGNFIGVLHAAFQSAQKGHEDEEGQDGAGHNGDHGQDDGVVAQRVQAGEDIVAFRLDNDGDAGKLVFFVIVEHGHAVVAHKFLDARLAVGRGHHFLIIGDGL